MARFKETRGALDDAGSRAMAASRAAESLADPAAQTRAKGMMKAATGNEAKLTPAERKAVAGSKTREGLPYFEKAENGKTRMTEAGRAEFVKEHPEAGRLLDHRDEVKGQRARHVDGERTSRRSAGLLHDRHVQVSFRGATPGGARSPSAAGNHSPHNK